jgi:23S rRNA (guanosine2251-2'-O)-methyltransferase
MKKNNIQYEIIYGIHPIQEFLHAKKRKMYELYIDETREKNVTSILKNIPSYTTVRFVKKGFLDNMANYEEHQGIVASVSPIQFQKELFNAAPHEIILFCDSIQDTKNLGALLRSAYCTGITKVIVTTKNSAPISSHTFKASAGLAEYLQIHRTDNPVDTMQELKKKGFTILLAAAGGQPIEKYDITYPLVIVIGNEHTGIQKKLFEYGTIVSLSQNRSDISYNASVAGGILLYTIKYFSLKTEVSITTS